MSLRFAISATVLLLGISVFAAENPVNADNSAKNKQQLENNEIDARDQGSSKSDVETTRKIRQAVVKEDSLSTNAKNVKIITMKGHVTLKGPVKSMDESKKVEMLARKVAGKAHVMNELEIEKQ